MSPSTQAQDDTQYMKEMAEHEKHTLTVEDQKKIGTPLEGDIKEEHRNFMKTLIGILDSGEIDPYEPKTFLNMDVYESLDEQWQDKVDLALVNISNQVRLIHEFHVSNDTPDESPQLQTMVEHLWEMKQRIEEHYDVFKF